MNYDKNTLIRNFSRHAHLYDRYANIQRMAASELLKDLPEEGIAKILEIGCGTGNYTCILKNRFRKARLKAIDISTKMIEIAGHKLRDEDIEFVVCDAETMRGGERFDLITSNATFQWFENLENAVINYRGMVADKGAMIFSTFGPMTFWELNKSLGEISGKEKLASSSYFLDKDRLSGILRKYFAKVNLRELLMKEEYASLMELLSKIKYTGARGNGTHIPFVWEKAMLKRAEDIYKREFKKIEASYQIFFCKATL